MLDFTRERLRIWLRRSAVAGALVAASLTLAACGSSGSITTLNSRKVERAIERSSLAQRGVHAQVSCPSDVPQKKGMVFSCIALVKDTSTRFVVTQQDEAGHVRYEAP
jgi:Domain of unknown function (DUF4333)